jgi:hypothetical protein
MRGVDGGVDAPDAEGRHRLTLVAEQHVRVREHVVAEAQPRSGLIGQRELRVDRGQDAATPGLPEDVRQAPVVEVGEVEQAPAVDERRRRRAAIQDRGRIGPGLEAWQAVGHRPLGTAEEEDVDGDGGLAVRLGQVGRAQAGLGQHPRKELAERVAPDRRTDLHG